MKTTVFRQLRVWNQCLHLQNHLRWHLKLKCAWKKTLCAHLGVTWHLLHSSFCWSPSLTLYRQFIEWPVCCDWKVTMRGHNGPNRRSSPPVCEPKVKLNLDKPFYTFQILIYMAETQNATCGKAMHLQVPPKYICNHIKLLLYTRHPLHKARH